jgi:Ala-tRNA(Pro) deacylase
MYVVDYLRGRRVWFETFLHCPASSAARLAGCVHVPGRSVAKTILVKAQGAYLLTVLPATSCVDLARLGHALGLDPGEVKLASPAEIEQIFHDCEPGTIPPFGRLYELRTVVDVSLQGAGVLVFRTNTRHLGIRMQFGDYESLEEPLRADFARPINFGTGQSSSRNRHRRAG